MLGQSYVVAVRTVSDLLSIPRAGCRERKQGSTDTAVYCLLRIITVKS